MPIYKINITGDKLANALDWCLDNVKPEEFHIEKCDQEDFAWITQQKENYFCCHEYCGYYYFLQNRERQYINFFHTNYREAHHIFRLKFYFKDENIAFRFKLIWV